MLGPWASAVSLIKRINVPVTASTTPAEIAAMNEDPWAQSGKYARGWVYFALVLLFLSTVVRFYHVWGDKIRIALYKEDRSVLGPDRPLRSGHEQHELPSAATDNSAAQFFPARTTTGFSPPKKQQSLVSTIAPLNNAIAFLRWAIYRPMPVIRLGRIEIVFPSRGALVIVHAALVFVTLYCFLPRPLYFPSIKYGSPPLAIRAGMIAIAMVPWIVALSTKANFISMLTGIGHERLNVLHRWGGYLCLFLSLIHTIPFYVTPIWEDGAYYNYQKYLPRNMYVYGTGVAALVPLVFLCVHSLPLLRQWMYEVFVTLHLPVSIVFVAMLFWHSKNFLASWDYLWATVAIWLLSSCLRVFYLNWSNPLRMSFLIGEESAVTILPENAVKVTVPTRMRWRPGQYVYLRMPGISMMGNHPFTIASLCSDDFPSEYGEKYRDLAVVFRPFRGFTRKVFERALEQGPYKTYSAFLEGPYGGMQREMAAFDDVIFFAGGSGITAIASQLLDLIKKMRDGKAVTKHVQVIWALKSPDTMEWFKEELRICRDFAPPNTVFCQFFLTGPRPEPQQIGVGPDARWLSGRDIVQEKIYEMLEGIDKRNSAFIPENAVGDAREKTLLQGNEDAITALPQAHLALHSHRPAPPPQQRRQQQQQQELQQQYSPYNSPYADSYTGVHYTGAPSQGFTGQTTSNVPFDFGFGTAQQAHSQQVQLQQAEAHAGDGGTSPAAISLATPRFAVLPARRQEGWRTEYCRPDISRMLTEFSDKFGRRACVFVCGPPSMRVEVARCVASLQLKVVGDGAVDEIFLHAENYSI